MSSNSCIIEDEDTDGNITYKFIPGYKGEIKDNNIVIGGFKDCIKQYERIQSNVRDNRAVFEFLSNNQYLDEDSNNLENSYYDPSDISDLVNEFKDKKDKIAPIQTYCSNIMDYNTRTYLKPDICNCYDDFKLNDEMYSMLKTDCGSEVCNSLIASPHCLDPKCKLANDSYNIFTSQCPSLCLQNIWNSGSMSIGDLTLVCDMQGSETCNLAPEECDRLCDSLLASGAPDLPVYCKACEINPDSQDCANLNNSPCTGPNRERYPQCKANNPSCHVLDPDIACTQNKYCFEDIPPEGTYQTKNYVVPDRPICDINFDDPANGITNDVCHVKNPPQKCFDYGNIPCLGPESSKYWQCKDNVYSECKITYPDQNCYCYFDSCCNFPYSNLPQCTDDLNPKCYGGPNCICDNTSLKNSSLYNNKEENKLKNKTEFLDNSNNNENNFNLDESNKIDNSNFEFIKTNLDLNQKMNTNTNTKSSSFFSFFDYMFIILAVIICIIFIIKNGFTLKSVFIVLIIIFISFLILKYIL